VKRTFAILSLLLVASNCLAEEYTLAAAPHAKLEEELKIYGPLAEYLSRKTGATIKFVYMKDWFTYRKAVHSDTHDIYFGDAHFSSFQVEFRRHRYIASLKEPLTFVVVTSSYNDKISELRDLVGRQSCLLPEPNFATLLFLSEFTNAARQPAINTNLKEWRQTYDAVMAKRCDGTVMPYRVFSGLNAAKPEDATIVHTFKPVPNLTFTVGPGMPAAIADKLKTALTQSGNEKGLQEFFRSYVAKEIIAVDPDRYGSLYDILRNDYLLGKEIAARKR